MPIVGGLDIHRKQLTFDYIDTVTGEVKRGQVAPADREPAINHSRSTRSTMTPTSNPNHSPQQHVHPR